MFEYMLKNSMPISVSSIVPRTGRPSAQIFNKSCCLTSAKQLAFIDWLAPVFSRGQRSKICSQNIAKRSRQPSRFIRHFATTSDPSSISSSIGSTPAARICILGGGFGGLYTAIRLQSLLWPQGQKPQVTLVDKADRFVFKPLLYEVVNGSAGVEEVAPPFVKLLAPYPITFVQGAVESIEAHDSGTDKLSGGKILLEEGGSLEYDWLVLSLGSAASTLGVPGVKEFAFVFNTIEDALQVQRALSAMADSRANEVIVVGSGPAGVELATTVADRLGSRASVHLISTGPEILKGLPSSHRAAAEEVLQRKQVDVVRNSLATEIRAGSEIGPSGLPRRKVQLESKLGGPRVMEADLVLWATGSQPSSKAGASMKLPFPVTEKGTTKTDNTLRVVGHPRVFALGDLATASADGQQLANVPATAQVAFQQADYAAWNIWAAIHNRPLLPFKYQHLGDMMSLGKMDGAVTLPLGLPPDLHKAIQASPVGPVLRIAGIRLGGPDAGLTLEGPLGALVRRAAYWYRQPTAEHRLEVGSTWLQQAILQGSGRFQSKP